MSRPGPTASVSASAIPPTPWAMLAALPLVYFTLLVLLQAEATPYWLWVNVDPSYFYLLNGLEIARLEPPADFHHPGTTTQTLVALILRLAHPTLSAEALTDGVLADPEAALMLTGRVFSALIAASMLWAGLAAWRTFGRRLETLLVQAAPLFSTVVFINAYAVKPEATLVVIVNLLAVVTMTALRPDRNAGSGRIALAFGAVIAAGIVTKLHVLPLALAPLVLLPTLAARLRYGLWTVVFLGVFLAPALPILDEMIGWFHGIASHSGAYGQGQRDWLPDGYLLNAVTQLRRPLFSVPLILGALVLWLRRRDLTAREIPLARALAGLILAQAAQILLIAKHPISYYLIPSFLLIGMVTALLLVLAEPMLVRRTRHYRTAWAVLLCLLILPQARTIAATFETRQEERAKALAVDMRPFEHCTKVYFDFASEPAYALALGNQLAGYRFADRLAARFPDDIHVWVLANGLPQRWSEDRIALSEIVGRRSCTVFRGAWGRDFAGRIRQTLPEADLRACTNGDEHVLTLGIDCAGAFPAAAVPASRP